VERHHGARWAPLLLIIGIIGFAATVPADSPSLPLAPAELKLPADIVYSHSLSADSVVVFRHATHFDAAGRVCTGCHPRPFSMLSAQHRERHAVMNAGGSCGTCHDGKTAFGVRDASSCRSCHSGRRPPAQAAATVGRRGAPPPAGGGPPPIVYARSAGSPGKVAFRHATHTRGTSCSACHPAPFRMKALATAASAMHESGGCGKCHDGKAAFGAQDSKSCARCHQGAAP
jgi:c(7)-type cytochrome triheme protein